MQDESYRDRCWEWPGARDAKGYGYVKKTLAHRVMYEMAKGPIPAGLMIRHKCDNPPCVNPSHLETGTALDNARDKAERGRQYGEHWVPATVPVPYRLLPDGSVVRADPQAA